MNPRIIALKQTYPNSTGLGIFHVSQLLDSKKKKKKTDTNYEILSPRWASSMKALHTENTAVSPTTVP